MTDQKTFYITTPIYYVNGVPHVGSATTTLLCDALARYHRQLSEPVFLLTGTDENAQKVADAAAKKGMNTQQFVDDVSQRYVETWQFLNVSNDDFIRTSESRHRAVVDEVFKRLRERGDIYAGKYEGWYSVSDETFFRDSEVENGKAIETGAVVERVTEDVYYFKLSAYAERLRSYINSHSHFLQPDTRKNEALAFINEGLRDVAISRRNTGWGIPVPGDPSQVVYVWFDALINYLTATGWPANAEWDKLWPANVHLVGKEIYVRFHATLWPAMLMGLDLPLPGNVLGHGWWLIKGEKGSKSKGNIPTPQEVVAHLTELSGCAPEVAVDALRYYLIQGISFTGDSEFSLEMLADKFNFDLANDLGNLLNRTLNMLKQYLGSEITASVERTTDGAMATAAREAAAEATAALDGLNPAGAIAATWKLISAANKEIDTTAPWKLNKAGDTQGVIDALYSILEVNRIVSVLIAPFMPHTSSLIRKQLGIEDGDAIPSWETAAQWGLLATGTRAGEAQPIFPRIDKEKLKKLTEAQTANTPAAAAQPKPAAPPAAPDTEKMITFDDVKKLQLRVAEIKTAERIEGAKKLLRLMIDVGEGTDRQLVAGIAESYSPEDLPGKKIIIFANLAPAVIRGVESQGMLLAATDAEGKAILLSPEKDVAPGAEVR